ncbi:hypothetical protein [Thiolinea disciformis]|uniref:hypothetical protein n=1 Tax=Thiolinea disciformis TaxID=125614 RepID=UPI00035E0CC1|nr:hypothetical protein [Thiolinea disciformis]
MLGLFKKNNIVLWALLSFAHQVSAIGFEVIENRIEVIGGEVYTDKKADDDSEYQTVDTVLVDQDVSTYIPYKRATGVLYFNIVAFMKTKVRLEWPDDSGLYSRVGHEVVFNKEGETKQVSFNVTKPTQGVISVYNLDNELIKTIPYRVTQQAAFTQNISGRLSQSDLDKPEQDASISYSIAPRTKPGDARWNMGVNLNSTLERESAPDKKSASVYFNYSW